jgi:hypothetical protein
MFLYHNCCICALIMRIFFLNSFQVIGETRKREEK